MSNLLPTLATKLAKLLSVAILAGVAVAAAGCGKRDYTYMKPAKDTLYGVWAKHGTDGVEATRITFRENNTYEIDMDGDQVRDIWGTFTLADKKMVLFTNDPSAEQCPGETAKYRYGFHGKNVVRFTPVKIDRCVDRRANLTLPWVRIEPPLAD